MKYENRIVLFLDILGFKNIIDKTVEKNIENEDAIEKLYRNLEEIKTFLIDRLKINKSLIYKENKSVIVTQFSDSIIISFESDKNATLLILIRTIQELIINLVNKGILCRGAISYGKLIHNEKIIFGPALNDAYETETKAAIYPRIILDKSIIELGSITKKSKEKFFSKEDIIMNYLSKDTDEKYFINYFSKKLFDYVYVTNVESYLTNLRTIIINGSKSTKPDIKIKYGWMKNKYNFLIESLKSEDEIKEISKVAGLFEYINKVSLIN